MVGTRANAAEVFVVGTDGVGSADGTDVVGAKASKGDEDVCIEQ